MAAYVPRGELFHRSFQKKKSSRFTKLWERLRPLRVHRTRSSTPQSVVAGMQRKKTPPVKYCLRCLIVLASAVICMLAAQSALQLLKNSDVFRIADIQVNGNKVINRQSVLSTAGVDLGNSLISLQCSELKDRLEALDHIESAEVKKYWPSTLAIRVREFAPMAMVYVQNESGDGLYYMDQDGRLFAKREPGQELDFPVITGIQIPDPPRSVSLPNEGPTGAALTLLKLAARGDVILPIQSISEVHLDMQQGVVVYLVDQTFPIYFGHEKIRTKYHRLVAILDHLYKKNSIEGVKAIRMDYMQNKVLVARAEMDR